MNAFHIIGFIGIGCYVMLTITDWLIDVIRKLVD